MYRVENVNLRLVHQERLEEQRRDGRSLGEHDKDGVDKGQSVQLVEDGQEGHLRKIGEHEQYCEDKDREQQAWYQPASKQRPQKPVTREVVDPLCPSTLARLERFDSAGGMFESLAEDTVVGKTVARALRTHRGSVCFHYGGISIGKYGIEGLRTLKG